MFEEIKHAARRTATVRRNTNLTPLQHHLLRELTADDRFVVVPSDKNLGPAIMDCEIYIKRALQDHLGNDKAFALLSSQQAHAILHKVKSDVKQLVMEHKKLLTTAEKAWFDRHFH
jgi:hypothetical protein